MLHDVKLYEIKDTSLILRQELKIDYLSMSGTSLSGNTLEWGLARRGAYSREELNRVITVYEDFSKIKKT